MIGRRSVVLGLALGACTPRTSEHRPAPPNVRAVGSPPDAASLNRALRSVARATRSPGISVSLLAPGGEGWSGQTGAGAEAWGSVTKLAVAAAAMSMVEDGTWSLDAPVGRYVPGLPWGGAMTLSDLMAHTSGLPRDIADAPRASRSAQAERAALAALRPARPGRFAYSNAGYRLLAVAMEVATDTPWQQVVRRRVLGPADSDGLTFPDRDAPPEFAAPGAAGGMRGPARDAARLLDALLGGRIVPRARARAMLSPLRRGDDPALRYGRGLMVYDLPDGETWIGHSGGTAEGRAVLAWMPRRDAIVALALRGAASAEAAASLLTEGRPGRFGADARVRR